MVIRDRVKTREYGHKGGSAPKHCWTEPELGIVRRDYDGTNASAHRIADYLGVSFYGVRGKVAQLGIAKVRHIRWTVEEDDLLRELVGKYAPVTISKKMGRSLNAVVVRSKRLGIHYKYRDGWYTKREVGEILGVDHKWIQARIDNDALKASWHHEHRPRQKGAGSWHISAESLKHFIKNYSGELTGRNVDLMQIVSILTDYGKEAVKVA